MPRRRLHGETQGRRKKKRTRLLKREGSITRTEATLAPAPFEKKPHPEREDLEFLEAMREMAVHRAPWGGEAPIRRRNTERVQFLAEDEERELFRESMDHLEVRPLGQGKSPARANPRHRSVAQAEEGLHRVEGALKDISPKAAPHAGAEVPPTAISSGLSSGISSVVPSGPEPAAGINPGPEKSILPRNPTPPRNPIPPHHHASPPITGITRFEELPSGQDKEDPAAAMEALMAGEAFDPSLKFAGSVTPPPRAGGETRQRFSEDLEPDGELDLHGKTQEEAIGMVQNFVMVSHRQRLRHILIITGKGKNSGQHGPVLGQAVFHWLERNGDRYVRDFIQAPPRLGGAGAIWITLR